MVRTKIRTYVKHGGGDSQFPVSTLVANWKSLRALDLCDMDLRSLPDTVGQLLHLRYLDLSENLDLKMLPKSLTKLINLQFLNLDGCDGLKELPTDLSKLVNLRSLYVPRLLEYMPLGMSKMTSLTRMNMFVVGQRKSCMKQEDRLEDIRALRNLKDMINFHENYKHSKDCCREGGNICNTEHLNAIHMQWPFRKNEGVGNDEDVLEDLQPHSNLKRFLIGSFNGVRMPRWAREHSLTTCLPNLVHIHLWSCDGLQELPWLGRLEHLKTLKLDNLRNVEYIENRTSIDSSIDDGAVASNSSWAVKSSTFFPSLEILHLGSMPMLKGWWRWMSNSNSTFGLESGLGMGEGEIVNSDSSMLTAPAHLFPSFPCLSQLSIQQCRNLASIHLCPTVQALELDDLNERFQTITKEDQDSVDSRSHYPKIRNINTGSLRYLKSLSMEVFQCLIKMEISGDDKVESLSEVEKVFRGCSSSLLSLRFYHCLNLRIVSPGGLELTALEKLELKNLPELSFDETVEEDGIVMSWNSLGKCLRTLILWELKKVVNLPNGLRYLTALQRLDIMDLPLRLYRSG